MYVAIILCGIGILAVAGIYAHGLIKLMKEGGCAGLDDELDDFEQAQCGDRHILLNNQLIKTHADPCDCDTSHNDYTDSDL